MRHFDTRMSVFVNQKRINVCEYTGKMALNGATRKTEEVFGWKTHKRAHGKLNEKFYTYGGLCQSEEDECMWSKDGTMWHYFYCVFAYFNPLLIDKDLLECQNISINFPCVFYTVYGFHQETASFFSVRIIHFYSYFVIHIWYFLF
jgi:hypothetical protein